MNPLQFTNVIILPTSIWSKVVLISSRDGHTVAVTVDFGEEFILPERLVGMLPVPLKGALTRVLESYSDYIESKTISTLDTEPAGFFAVSFLCINPKVGESLYDAYRRHISNASLCSFTGLSL